jgi:hypothetical protein
MRLSSWLQDGFYGSLNPMDDGITAWMEGITLRV